MKNDSKQSEREFIDYRFNEIVKRLERMEQTMNGFAFVKQSDFDDFKREVKETFATKEEIKPMSKTYWGILLAGCAGLVGLVYWLIQLLVQKAIS